MRYRTSATTAAEPSRLWAVVSDVEKWPDWIEVYEEGRVFAWQSRQPGVRITGRHVVSAEPGGGSRLTLQLEITGWLSGVVDALVGRKSRAYVDVECARLAEVAAQPTTA